MIDINKQYRTRGGREVKLLMTDGGGNHPVVGAILDNDCWSPMKWVQDGRWSYRGESSSDLIEVKPRIKREAWVNVYPDGYLQGYGHRTGADAMALQGRIACAKITIDVEEGEGLP